MYASSNPSHKHDKKASQNMRKKSKIHKLLLQFPASKSYPQAPKGPVYISFRINKRSLTSPEYLASFWDQIPLQMAKIS
jgi:hypothetical protein